MPKLKAMIAVVLLCLWCLPAQAAPVRVFAAASLKTAMDQMLAKWTAASGKQGTGVYAATPALAKQIAEGAPADIFMSADQAWMDDLASKNLIRPETRSDLLGNTLVLVVAADSPASIELKEGADLRALLGDGRLAVGDTAAVPAGRYAKAALQSLQLWDGVSDRLAEAENVRAALLVVERGEAAAGIVYGSDAIADPKVRVIATFPEHSHPPIVYPVAIVAASVNPDAAPLLAYLRSPEAAGIFASQGFIVLK
jgi:molybdate transport system substrate-binding protein